MLRFSIQSLDYSSVGIMVDTRYPNTHPRQCVNNYWYNSSHFMKWKCSYLKLAKLVEIYLKRSLEICIKYCYHHLKPVSCSKGWFRYQCCIFLFRSSILRCSCSLFLCLEHACVFSSHIKMAVLLIPKLSCEFLQSCIVASERLWLLIKHHELLQ